MMFSIEVTLGVILFLLGIIGTWTRFNNAKLFKRIDDLIEKNDSGGKEMDEIKYNYLDRFNTVE